MNRGLACAAVLISLLAPTGAPGGSREQAASAVAGEWLALVDSGAYRASWEQASSLFRAAVDAAQWEETVTAARVPFGAFVSRELMSASYTTSLPGAPEGEYVVIQYRAVYENRPSAVETVTPMREDGAWRVSGYFIK